MLKFFISKESKNLKHGKMTRLCMSTVAVLIVRHSSTANKSGWRFMGFSQTFSLCMKIWFRIAKFKVLFVTTYVHCKHIRPGMPIMQPSNFVRNCFLDWLIRRCCRRTAGRCCTLISRNRQRTTRKDSPTIMVSCLAPVKRSC